MMDFNEKKDGKIKIFFKKVWCVIKNNWQYKLLAIGTAIVIWMCVGYIF